MIFPYPMPSAISGNDIDRRTILSKVVQKWIRLNREVAETWDGKDVPWWYGERASLSILAGAIWQLGGIAFEEYSEEKHRATQRGERRRSYSGRCDLFFQIAGKDFTAEAKQTWPGGTTDRDPTSRIQKSLRAARKAASRLSPNGLHRLAIVFIVPRFKGNYRKDPERMIGRWIDRVCENPKWGKWRKAWSFPAVSRRFKSRDSGRYYPGVVIFLRAVPRSLRDA